VKKERGKTRGDATLGARKKPRGPEKKKGEKGGPTKNRPRGPRTHGENAKKCKTKGGNRNVGKEPQVATISRKETRGTLGKRKTRRGAESRK